jgi:aminoglycoside N3'-acetyltransferase
MAARAPRTLAAFNRNVLPLLDKASRGSRILNDIKSIIATDRWNSFDRFHDTTNFLVKSYGEAGASADVYKIPTGGPVGSGRWIIPHAADIRSATLDIIRPTKQRVLNYRDNPWHVIQWSSATPPKGLECELVVIDDDDQLKSMRSGALQNKLLLTRLDVRLHLKTIADKGAVGLITDAGQKDLPRATSWTKFGWGALPMDRAQVNLVGLVLSTTDGNKLRASTKKYGSLTLRVKVDIRSYAGTHDLVSGLVTGSENPQDEVWALAHSAEPGAHDNASGVALCLEIARTLENLIASGKLPRPKRTIRLLSGYECYSFFHYIEHVRRFQAPLAGVCIDTVGARPEICNGQLSWRSTIPMSATFVDRVGASILQATLKRIKAGYKLAEGGFVSTSDTLAGDPKYGFPCPWIATHFRKNDQAWKAYHSSNDTPPVLSANGLKACAVGMAGYLYYLANLNTQGVLDLAQSETDHTEAQLSSARSPEAADYLRQQHSITLNRLQRWLWTGDRSKILTRLSNCEARIQTAGSPKRPKRPRIPQSAKRIPYRTAPISPTLENTPTPIADRIRKSGLAAWALFWADGQRNLSDIAQCLSIERGKAVEIENVITFFEAHEQLGYIRLTPPENLLTKTQLRHDLKALGLESGMDVMVHSSLSAIGHVQDGPNTVIDAILSQIGKRGTLVMPSFNHGGAHIYNPLATPTTNGAIPDAFWRRPGVIRSLHPTHALAAFGPKAETICANHLTTGIWTADSPLSRFIHDGGYILSLGVDHNSSTAYHVAELSVPCGCIDPFGNIGQIVMPDGSVQNVPGLAFRSGSCPVDPRKLNRALKNRQDHDKVGNADSTLVKALDLWHARRRHLKNVCPTCPVKPHYRK